MRASLRASGVVAALFLAVAVASACGPGNASGPGAVTAPPGGDLDASAGTPPSPTPSSSAPAASSGDSIRTGASGAKLCGCSLCEPVFSDDTCSADADCAPAVQCHADHCIAKSKAPAVKNMMCTEIMKCDTTDANRCACLSGRCALAPRKTP